MAEKRKNPKNRVRRNLIIIQIVAIVLVALVSVGMFIANNKMKETYTTPYTEKGSVEHKVITADGSTDVKEIVVDMSYTLDHGAEDAKYSYGYGITATLLIKDKTSGEVVAEHTYVLVPRENFNARHGAKIEIADQVSVDYARYNDRALDIISAYEAEAVGNLIISMNASVIGACGDVATYTASLSASVAEQEVTFATDAKEASGELAYVRDVNADAYFMAAVIVAIVAVAMLACLILYVLILKEKEAEEEEPAPVVAPVIEEEPVIIDEDVAKEDIEEALATPDLVLADIDFDEDDDNEVFVGTDDTPGVEVIGVVWPERAHKNKIYRYDPNGEILKPGDVILVPTYDAARDRDVVRKAAVAHGNHKVDPEHIQYTLKKIIGIVHHSL